MISTNINEALVPFKTIKKASAATGLSQYYLRQGCKDGSIPHIMSGNSYLINMPMLMDKLNELSGGQNID